MAKSKIPGMVESIKDVVTRPMNEKASRFLSTLFHGRIHYRTQMDFENESKLKELINNPDVDLKGMLPLEARILKEDYNGNSRGPVPYHKIPLADVKIYEGYIKAIVYRSKESEKIENGLRAAANHNWYQIDIDY